MNLLEQYNSKEYKTDKQTVHSYIQWVYNTLFDKYNTTNVLEIGAFDGGSALLWRDYFINAKVDIIDINECKMLYNQNRINHIVTNAYSEILIPTLNKYDIIIDDGPHTLDSMIFFIQHYIQLLKPNGVAIIEDIQDYSWFKILNSFLPDNFSSETVDLRPIKNRYDDLLLIIRPKHE